jgi:hypothetical protein
MSRSFGKYGVDELQSYNYSASDNIQQKKYKNIYCSIIENVDSGTYSDRSVIVKNNTLTYINSNDEHIQLTKAQYKHFIENDISYGFVSYIPSLKNQFCIDICNNNNDISNNYDISGLEPTITADSTIYAQIVDTSLNSQYFTNINSELIKKTANMSFPTKVVFDNNIC